MSEKEKYRQICREAAWTGISLLALIIFWLFAGFGLKDSGIEIFHMPLWAVMSSFGVWIFTIILVKCLTSFVFRDMPLDEKEENHAE
ncbi:YhdT family protein [Schwartzia sp. (in: firmicutes)]